MCILRAELFSPNSVAKDAAIMGAVADRLRQRGAVVSVVSEDRLPAVGSVPPPDLIVSMGRRPSTLRWLQSQTATVVVNSPEGVARCRRSVAERLLAENGLPLPPAEGSHGYWLKRGDGAAQTAGDVVYAPDGQALERAVGDFRQRGISSYTVTAHVVGDLVKFYGVLPVTPRTGDDAAGGFFHYCYPTDDGQTKFGDEHVNGKAHHYAFAAGDLQQAAERAARVVGVSVYGGDAIVRADGTFCIIDFNDWPSFSRCREEAAEAIAERVMVMVKGERRIVNSNYREE